MDRINVLHIRDSRGIYGAERVILTLAKHLNPTRFRVLLLCFEGKDGLASRLIRTARRLDLAVETVKVNGRLDPSAIRQIREILKAHSVSIVHAHDFKGTFYALLASANLGIKRVVTAHGSTRDSLLMKAYLFLDEHVVYRFFDKIIAVAEYVREDLKRKGLNAQRIEVIPNAVDPSLLDLDGKDPSPAAVPCPSKGAKVFGVIGRLFPDKGHEFFLEAFRRVVDTDPSAQALIVGGGPLKDHLTDRIRTLALEHHVHLCGVQSDMKSIYDQLDFLVIPSLREGLPYVLLEALACKVPVLATAVGDIPRLVEHGHTGFLVPPADAAALARYMRRLLIDPEEASRMADNGSRLVRERYSATRMAAQTERLYETLLARSSPRAPRRSR